MTRTRWTVCGVAFLLTIPVWLSAQNATDWTQFRGPARDGSVASFTEPRAWPNQLTK